MNLLEVSNVSKTYGSGEAAVKALKKVSFSVPKGEYVAIVGESGSGKSTLLNMIGALDTPTCGKVVISGKEIFSMNDRKLTIFRRRNIGFIFQAFNLIPELTVEQNIVFPMLLDYQEPDRKYLEELLSVLNLKERRRHLPSQLSGGQQQRVAIARALVKMPRVLLLDEPLSNLDARLRLQTREEIRRIQKETGITTIFVTHDQEEAMSISDMIVVMKDGIVQQIGKPQEVYDNPANLFVAKFLGTPPINVFDGQIRDGRLYIGEDAVMELKNAENREVYVGIRPEGFLLREDGPFQCGLSGIEVMGRDISVLCTNKASLNPTVRAIIGTENNINIEKLSARFALAPHKVFLFDKETEKKAEFDR